MRVLAHLVLARFFLSGVSFLLPVLAQSPASGSPVSRVDSVPSPSPTQDISSVDIDIDVQGPDNTNVEETSAVTLITVAGQLYRQDTAKKGHLRWTEVAPVRYLIQVITPGFEPMGREIDAHGASEVKVTLQLRPQAGENKTYPIVSPDPEVNYVFGRYASQLGDWDQAKSYWTRVLHDVPDFVPAVVAMSEVLLRENKTSEAAQSLDRAAKLDPSYWRTQAVLAELFFRTGSAREAVRHAESAIELGHAEAAGVSPLLARALVAEASDVMGAYLEDHPGDVAAKKQFESLSAPSEPHVSVNLNAGSRESSESASLTSRASPPGDHRWSPPEVDENDLTVESGPACNLEEVLLKAGQRIQEFVGNVERFTATESLLHETINKSGEASKRENRRYDYVVSIDEVQRGLLDVEEYLNGNLTPGDYPGGVITRGLPALILIFHPYYSGNFSMTCEGVKTLNGKRTWQIYFRQRADRPNRTRQYQMGMYGQPHPVALKGRAWFVVGSYQTVRLQTDLINTLPELRLTVDHTSIEYGPVHFTSRGLDMWLPQTAEVYSDLKGRRIHQRMDFSNYLLFSVDDKQKISLPKISR